MELIKNIVFIQEPPKEIRNQIFDSCKIKEYNFYKATIEDCIFIDCDLSESNFSKAIIRNCKFVNCYMQFCALTKVSIYNCEFHNCDFWHSNLCHSTIHETLFNKCVLKALFKELDWKNNDYDMETIIESCGGNTCGLNNSIVLELLSVSKRTQSVANY